MKKELDEKLCRDFPLLYADRKAPMQTTCMCWGFSCNDGWYDLIYEVSAKLEAIIQKWVDENGEENHPRASQVKEKFGGLRFYMSHYLEEFDEPIRLAEAKAMKTCEWCGKPGELVTGGWLRTLCPACEKKDEEGWKPWLDKNE